MITQKILNSHVCSSDDSESKSIIVDESVSKRVIVNAYSLEERRLKSVHISVNTSKVKDTNNESVNESESKDAKNKTKD